MWAPFLGWALPLYKPIAINRRAGRTATEQVIEEGQQRLNDGLWVMIFPEGTRVASGESKRMVWAVLFSRLQPVARLCLLRTTLVNFGLGVAG